MKGGGGGWREVGEWPACLHLGGVSLVEVVELLGLLLGLRLGRVVATGALGIDRLVPLDLCGGGN